MNYLLRLTPSGIQIRGMAHAHSLRHPLFRRRWFTDEVIITCVRWYLRFKLSTTIRKYDDVFLESNRRRNLIGFHQSNNVSDAKKEPI